MRCESKEKLFSELQRQDTRGHSGDFDLIAVDAFSSDSIPIHLLTAESADIYRKRLSPGGVLALHISNHALNLDPVARGMAIYLGWTAVQVFSRDNPETGESSSRWVLITPNQELLERAGLAHRVSKLEQQRVDRVDGRLCEPVARS